MRGLFCAMTPRRSITRHVSLTASARRSSLKSPLGPLRQKSIRQASDGESSGLPYLSTNLRVFEPRQWQFRVFALATSSFLWRSGAKVASPPAWEEQFEHIVDGDDAEDLAVVGIHDRSHGQIEV